MHVKKLDIVRRFAFIETRVVWAGGVTAGALGEAFGISRQSAQAVISGYRHSCPDNLFLDRKRHCHVATEGFKPHFIGNGSGPFLDYLRGQAALSHYLEDAEWSEIPFVDGDRQLRPKVSDRAIQPVLGALYRRQTVHIHYQSKYHRTWRTVSPHHLVFIGNRYHIRAYCFHSNAFRDFALSRILYAEPGDEDWISEREDKEWNRYEELIFQPRPDITAEQLATLSLDYDYDGEKLLIHCRKALSFYMVRTLVEQGMLKRGNPTKSD